MPLLFYAYVDSVPFTPEVLAGESSLGGSESACLGLCQALARRGHDVHIFATRLDEGCDHEWRGVSWHHAETLPTTLAFAPPDVFISLRMPQVFSLPIPARMTILWGQDLMSDPEMVGQLAQVDHVAYVSEFHRKQWEDLQPILAPLGWVTRNGIDPEDIPDLSLVPRVPNRFIYSSRPERGLKPLLEMWPAIRAALPDAELLVCRYRSMYDGEGSNVARMVSDYDRLTDQVKEATGGIKVLGQLSKPQLYHALAGARLLLYPGVIDFAETNGIAWTEAQACGTPIVGSWRGAAPETVHRDAGVLLDGDALTLEYQARFVAEVVRLATDDAAWAGMSAAGRTHALPRCSHDTIAAEWEAQIGTWFQERYEANRLPILRSLMWWDNHVAAKQLAALMPDEPEAVEALALCARVIAQQEATATDYALYAYQDPQAEINGDKRLHQAAERIAEVAPRTVLDLACGNGAMALLLSQMVPDATIHGWDSSQGVLAIGQAAAQRTGVAGRVTFHGGDWTSVHGVYDAVFCGEFIEHVERPWELLDRLEQHCAPDGLIVLTCPSGPFVELLDESVPRKRGHVHTFTVRDLGHMGRDKRDWSVNYMALGITPRGSTVGYWQVSYRPGGGPALPIDYTQDIVTTRPYQRIAATLIVKDGADHLRQCLRSIRRVVDRVVVLDTGSTDGSQALARSLGAEVVQTPWPDDFSAARNQVLDLVEHDCEWVLWIDADEVLSDGQQMRKYVTGAGPFAGYVLKQTHLMADQPQFSDKPVRLFKTGRGVRFYGPVHEQPEDKPDAGIFPALELPDAQILHYGYTTDPIRREKLLYRNMRLLKRELASETPRQLAYVLAIRDYVNLALFARESAGGALTPGARRYLLQAVALYRAHFTDPAHRLHELARPYYDGALEQLGQGWEVEWAFAAAPRKLAGRVKPQRFRVSSSAELESEIQSKLAIWLGRTKGPAFACDPIVTRNGDGGWGLMPGGETTGEADHEEGIPC